MAEAGYSDIVSHVWRLELYFEETFIENAFTLEDLVHVFQYFPNLTHLSIQMNPTGQYTGGMYRTKKNNVGLANVLKEGFGKLEYVKLGNCLRNMFQNSWPIYQEILT